MKSLKEVMLVSFNCLDYLDCREMTLANQSVRQMTCCPMKRFIFRMHEISLYSSVPNQWKEILLYLTIKALHTIIQM